jgi:hypothetical protein
MHRGMSAKLRNGKNHWIAGRSLHTRTTIVVWKPPT